MVTPKSTDLKKPKWTKIVNIANINRRNMERFRGRDLFIKKDLIL